MLRNNSKRLFIRLCCILSLTALPARVSQTGRVNVKQNRKEAFIDGFRLVMNLYHFLRDIFINRSGAEYKAPLNHLYQTQLAPHPERHCDSYTPIAIRHLISLSSRTVYLRANHLLLPIKDWKNSPLTFSVAKLVDIFTRSTMGTSQSHKQNNQCRASTRLQVRNDGRKPDGIGQAGPSD